MKRIVILGSTGSVGQNALSVVAAHPDEFEIVGLSTNQSIEKLETQIQQFRPRVVAVANPCDVLNVVLIVEHCDDSLDHIIQSRAESPARDDRGFGCVWIVKNSLTRACFLEAREY